MTHDDRLIPPSTAPSAAIAAATDIHDLLRHRIATAINGLSKGSRRAYTTGLAQFARWLRVWIPTAPEAIRAAVGDSVEWSDVVVRLDQVAGRSAPLIASTIVDEFLTAIADRSSATRALRLAALRWVLKRARSADVRWTIDVEAPKVEPYRDVRGPGANALHQVYDTVDQHDDEVAARDLCLLGLVGPMALRRKEACEPLVQHYDRTSTSRRLSIIGKRRSQREWVSVPPEVAAHLDAYLELRGQPDPAEPLLLAYSPHHLGRGHALSPDGATARCRVLGVQAGLPGRLSPHRIRHTSITTALSTNDPRVVQQFSRHVKIDTLFKYDDARRDLAAGVAAGVAAAIGVPPPRPRSPRPRRTRGKSRK
jgi:integrase/recombinase XerC